MDCFLLAGQNFFWRMMVSSELGFFRCIFDLCILFFKWPIIALFMFNEFFWCVYRVLLGSVFLCGFENWFEVWVKRRNDFFCYSAFSLCCAFAIMANDSIFVCLDFMLSFFWDVALWCLFRFWGKEEKWQRSWNREYTYNDRISYA